MVEDLSSRAEITEVLLRYVRGIDRCDETLLRDCFHPDATHEHGAFKGASVDFCAFALDLVRGLDLSHHQLGPPSIEIAGDAAFTETYYTSYHRRGGEDRLSGGRYVDRFERRCGVWRIAARRGIVEWVRHEPAADRGFFEGPPEQRGRRDRSDPVYRR